MKKRSVTLQAVAERAGVNRVTAAVALGRSPQGGTRVSPATRLRVETAALELGYAPNAIAQALRGERTNIVGYYAGYETLDAHSPFTAAILQGLQRRCRTYNQDLLLFGSFIRDTVDSIYATVTSGKIDGLVLLPRVGRQFCPICHRAIPRWASRLKFQPRAVSMPKPPLPKGIHWKITPTRA